MPAPSTFPDFDTNGTHTTAVTSGHASDGFASNEVPSSAELNTLLMLYGLWIRWFGTSATKVHNATAFTPGSNVAVSGEPGLAPYNPVFLRSSAAGAAWSAMQYAVGGYKISTVDWEVRIPAGGGSVVLVVARQLNDGSAGEVVSSTTHTLVANPSAVWETVTHTVNHTCAAGYSYWLRVEMAASTTDAMSATVNP